MKKISSKIGFFLGILLIVLSCDDDTFILSDEFVDVEPPLENSDNYFNSEQDYYDALIGAYDLLQTTYLNAILGEIASDNTLCGGENATDVIAWQQIDDMIHTPVNDQLEQLFGWMYSGVNRANYILEFKDNLDFDGKEVILAEATFLRAYYYFELVKWFGDVPLVVDQRILFGDEQELDRTPVAEIYAQLETDLQYAVDNLSYTPEDGQIGRATRGAAQALLGKVYLYQDKFAEAATVLGDLINNGPYDLLVDYSTMFENDNENNIESVFEVQYTDEEGAGFDCFECSEGNIAVGFSGVRRYNGPLFESGFSFNVPTQEAYDAFEDGDVRRDIAILNIVAWAEETGATYGEGFEHTGFFNRKYLPRAGDANIGDANLTNPNNYRAIRFADVLLMAAEANNRGGISDAAALSYLNRVRDRAGLPEINLTGSGLTDAIYQERRVELMGEGHRFFDLVRTGQAASTIPGFQAGKNELFPIPLTEIQNTGNRWEQNPGY